jgi:hypothetical protein
VAKIKKALGEKPQKAPKPHEGATAGPLGQKVFKHGPKRRASWRAANAGKRRSYRVWTDNSLIEWFQKHGLLTEAADPDRVAEVLAAAAQAAEPERIREVLSEFDKRKNIS